MLCGLLGHGIAYSLSPRVHALLGDYDYELFDLPPEELRDFMADAPFDGLNVTIPYKQAVMPYCSDLSMVAAFCNSVNTVLRDGDGYLHGHNTDLPGFLWLLTHLGQSLRGQKVMILGSGATANTVAAAAQHQGAADIVAVSRRGPVSYHDLSAHYDSTVIVNTTPVSDRRLLELNHFSCLNAVIDVIYAPAQTPLLDDAHARGIPYSNGLPLLAAQAKYASDLFLGLTRDDAVIEEILASLRSPAAGA
ncbi:MAG: hypothetical protein Q4B48_04575 [Syntrophomonadaceae bacterium]|nr:hypothetical protein [Syntrophomonadaceae bacterium]